MPQDDNRLEQAAHVPFIPESATVECRVANALEYIAVQLGEINRKLDRLNVSSTKESLQDQMDMIHKI